MLTSELPVYKDTFDLVSLIMDYTPSFPKSYKHTIGQKMTNVSLELFEYLQHYSKGVKFTGMVVKPARTYVGNATRSSAVGKVRAFNRLAECEDYKAEHHVLHFVSSMNSYLGFFKHHKSYDIRHGLVKSISPQWWRVASFTSGATKITANKKYKPKYKRLCLE